METRGLVLSPINILFSKTVNVPNEKFRDLAIWYKQLLQMFYLSLINCLNKSYFTLVLIKAQMLLCFLITMTNTQRRQQRFTLSQSEFQSRAVLLYDPETEKRQDSMVGGASNHGGCRCSVTLLQIPFLPLYYIHDPSPLHGTAPFRCGPTSYLINSP